MLLLDEPLQMTDLNLSRSRITDHARERFEPKMPLILFWDSYKDRKCPLVPTGNCAVLSAKRWKFTRSTLEVVIPQHDSITLAMPAKLRSHFSNI
jgi:hypothetical protein